MIRFLAWVRRTVEDAVSVLPYFPAPAATCPAHGRRYCKPCSRNPNSCISDLGGCGYWIATGMHWDTCPNRVKHQLYN